MNDRRSFMKYAFGMLVLEQATCANATAATVTMVPGRSKIIQYKHWSGQLWTASLQNIACRFNGFGICTITIDPDFHHVGPFPSSSAHDDRWIQYIAWDNRNWASQCHAHTQSSNVSFTFEHFRQGHLNHHDHEDETIGFIAWDNTRWLASAPAVGLISHGTEEVYFNLTKH